MYRRNSIFRFDLVFGLILLLVGSLSSTAQEQEYFYDHFNISTGLISDMVYKIVVDQEGQSWIVTYNGLQKYDGYIFDTYTFNPEKPGTLSSNFVENIYEDREGYMIVVLEDGIDIYDKQTGRFVNLLKGMEYAEIRRDEISRRASAVQDRTGSVWVNCNNRLVRIDSTKKNFIVKPDDFRGSFVLNRDSTVLWIITDESFKKYNLKKNLITITGIENIPAPRPIHRLNTIYYDTKGVCWLGTSDGLVVFDEISFRFLDPSDVLTALKSEQGSILNQDITAIYEDYRSDLWLVSGNSLYCIERVTGSIRDFQHEVDNPNSILGEQITGIHGDQSGIIWITYLNEGTTRINIRTRKFRSYRYRPGHRNSLGGKTVRSVFKDDRGYIWVGLYNDGLDRIEPAKERISHYNYRPDDRTGICSNYISSILLDQHRRLWIGSHDNGLCYADEPYSSELEFRTPPFLSSHEEIYHIQEDTLGRIWFGTRFGLGVYNYMSDSFQWVLTDHNIQSFVIDNLDIWIASWNNGLCKLTFQSDLFGSGIPVFDSAGSIFYPASDTEIRGQNNRYDNRRGPQNCISIYLDQQKVIWLGTYERGLVKAVDAGNEIIYNTYDESSGAPGNAVYGVTGDNQGNIWISTQHGIGKFYPETESFENYYREDGLLSNFFMWKSYFRAYDGELLFGSADGLNLFFPEEILRDTTSPRVLISEFRVHNRSIECGDTVNGDIILDRNITYQDTLTLNHRNRNFSFRFYAAGHPNPHKLIYSHMLAGFDSDWIENTGGNLTASYNNIYPGTYQFRVRATVNEAEWNGSYEEKVLYVLPPWWKTRLAYAFYILLILSLIFLITRSLIRFISLQHELKFNEKLHQSKLMFFTNISHEFKTPLSLIKAPLDDILNEKELSPHNRKNLHVAKQNADNLLNLVNELMEFRRTDTGVSKLQSEQIELTGFISEIISQFECIAEQKGVHFYFNIPDDPLKIWVDREKFRKIIHNLLENALRYTSENGLVTLSIIREPAKYEFKSNFHTLKLKQSKKDLEYIGLLVSDTGVGISKESLPRIFDRFYQIEAERAKHHIGSGIGLALVRNLVMMHKGEIRVASERGVGTDILVLLPLGDKHLDEKDKLVTADDQVYDVVLDFDEDHPSAGRRFLDETSDVQGLPSILLVEDHEELRQYIVEHLGDEFRVIEAANGKEGLQILKNTRPEVVITDWIMPVMDGAAFIEEIRSDETIASIPVIMLTAKGETKDWQEALDLGADHVIPKPFNLQLLRTQLRRIIINNRKRRRSYSIHDGVQLADIRENRETKFLEQLDRIIQKHISDPGLNAAVISKELGISRTVLYERIRSFTGQSIGTHIQKYRLKHAIRLMLYENVTVSEVYVKVGLSSSSYFIKLFKKYYQTTPKEYIRNYLKTVTN